MNWKDNSELKKIIVSEYANYLFDSCYDIFCMLTDQEKERIFDRLYKDRETFRTFFAEKYKFVIIVKESYAGREFLRLEKKEIK